MKQYMNFITKTIGVLFIVSSLYAFIFYPSYLSLLRPGPLSFVVAMSLVIAPLDLIVGIGLILLKKWAVFGALVMSLISFALTMIIMSLGYTYMQITYIIALFFLASSILLFFNKDKIKYSK